MITAIVGTWLAGAAYLPLDPAYPSARLGFMLADSRAALAIGPSAVLDELRGVRAVDTDDPQVAAELAGRPTGPPRAGAAGGETGHGVYTPRAAGAPQRAGG